MEDRPVLLKLFCVLFGKLVVSIPVWLSSEEV